MKLKVNGKEMDMEEGLTVEDLLAKIGAKPVGIAVELNREIVPRSSHHCRKLSDGDVLEVVRMVGGG